MIYLASWIHVLPWTCDSMFRSFLNLSLWQRSRFFCTPINGALISRKNDEIFRFIHTTLRLTDDAAKEKWSNRSLEDMLGMCEQILSTKDKKIEEYVFNNAVKSFCTRYATLLDTEQKLDLFQGLCARFSVTESKVDSLVSAITEFKSIFPQENGRYNVSDDKVRLQMLKSFQKLHLSSNFAYSDLLDAIAQSPQGVGFLVKLQADLVECIEMNHRNQSKELRVELRALSESIRQKLVVLFKNSSLLRLERVSWETSPASMMEQLGTEEKVRRRY